MRGFTEVQDLFDVIGDRAIVCGGWARYCASTAENIKPAADVDVYCTTEGNFSAIAAEFAASGKMPVYSERAVAITYGKDQTLFPGCPRIQLIKPIVQGRVVTMGSSEEILDNFDFSVVRACLVSSREVLVDADFINDETNHVLRINNIHCPISTMYRVIKYIGKGYWIRPVELVKLFVDWEQRTPEYRLRLLELFASSREATKEDPMSKQEIDELEALLHID